MSLDRTAATARIARQLKDAEQRIDDALLASSELMATLLRARASTSVVPHTGQAALIRLAEAQRSIINGANDMFRVHDVMASIGREMGVFDEEGSTPPSGLLQTSDEKAAA
ncbi:MAG: hypothetical protein H6916_07425 [Novosphingobium sp.]|uniref:hypothetical protein n=1 Tax=Novosphingobium sp. TaxID=1874826 RepID=UPI00261E0F0D|nr:hypothetical protein [Novosphingobium sp.]MCP5386634.1 hypothetical protein [Novosphingobium sp.]